MKRSREHDSAVSAVVGVMLMLVVTIIIAAVISAYAGGLGSTKEKAPQVSITARINVTDNKTIYFDHMGGDGFTIDDLIIILGQGEKNLRITNMTLGPSCELKNLGGSPFIRPGDTIMLTGNYEIGTSYTSFNASSTISINHNKEFTWTLLSQRSDAIMARGTLAFT